MKLNLSKYILIIPLVLFLSIMLFYPFFSNLYYSITDSTFSNIKDPKLLNNFFQNYITILKSDKFWASFFFSLKFAIFATIFEVLIGTILAIFLEPLIKNHKLLLIFILLPMMVAPSLLGIMYRLILNDFVGIIPKILSTFGVYMNFLVPPLLIWTLLIIEIFQWFPFVFLIIFSGLQGISDEVIEASYIDGAKYFQVQRYIVIPAILPFIVMSSFIRFVDSFRVFDHIFVLTGGGPGTSTTSLSIFIYKHFFQDEKIGESVAASIILMIIFLVPLVFSMKKTLRS